MVSVDDLVISLRIDETSNLGKLQKQLEALVGPAGEKAIELGAGIDPSLKRDLVKIKADLLLLTPALLGPGKPQVMRTAFGLAKDLEQIGNLRELLLEKYGLTEEELEGIEYQLLKIADDTSAMNKLQMERFVSLVSTFIKDVPRREGDRQTLLNKIREAFVETKITQEQWSRIFEKAGLTYAREFQLFVTMKDKLDQFEDLPDLIEQMENADKETFDKIIQAFKEGTDPLKTMDKVLNEILELQVNVLDLSETDILNNQDMLMALVGQLAAAREVDQTILETFYKAISERAGFAIGKGKEMSLDFAVKDIKGFIKEHKLEAVFGNIEDIRNTDIVEIKNVLRKGMVQRDILNNRFRKGIDRLVILAREMTPDAREELRKILARQENVGKSVTVVKSDIFSIEKSLGVVEDMETLRVAAMETHDIKMILARNIDQQTRDFTKIWSNFKELEAIMETYQKANFEISQEVIDGFRRYKEIMAILKDSGIEGFGEVPGLIDRLRTEVLDALQPGNIESDPTEDI